MKNNPEIEELRIATERLHNCSASYVESVEVFETFQGQTVWEGIVDVFYIKGNALATRCYTWSSPIEGSTKRKFFAVLHVPPVTSARDAVRAAIVQDTEPISETMVAKLVD